MTDKSETTKSPCWAVVLDGAGLYVADTEADAITMHQIFEYEFGWVNVVCSPVAQEIS